jgi:hypothetical protein
VRRRARAQQPAGEEPPEPFSRPKGALEPLEDGGSESQQFRHTYEAKSPCKAALNMSTVYASGKAQRPVAGQKLNYNAWLRMKLVGVMGPCLLKANSPWAKFYDDYKNRKESEGWGKNDAHRHMASVRYMVKMLIAQIWEDFRKFHDLPVRPSYAEEYLGRKHHEKPQRPQQTAEQRKSQRDWLMNAEIEAALAAEAGVAHDLGVK